jgi:hypothetical protein
MDDPGAAVGLRDEASLQEREMVAGLVDAVAADPDRHLTPEEIDRALGLGGPVSRTGR